MTSLKEREFLSDSKNYLSLTGFTEKPINRLANTKQTPTILDIETSHLKREIKKDLRDIVPLLEYQLWLEAGKMDKANFKSEQADEAMSYNSSIWRNFRSSAGLYSDRKGAVSESISSLYPINVPVSSRIGSNTLSRYYEQNRNIFKNEKNFNVAVKKVDKEATIMKYLSLKSEMRNPPVDFNGNILPPKNFRKYPPIFKTQTLEAAEKNSNFSFPHLNQLQSPKSDAFESLILNEQIKLESSSKKRPRKLLPTKLIYRQNHPDFDKVVMEQQIKGIYKSVTLNKN